VILTGVGSIPSLSATYFIVWCNDRWPPAIRSFGGGVQVPVEQGDAQPLSDELGVDLGQRARRLENVEVAIERDLVADPGLVVVDPGVRAQKNRETQDVPPLL
jgi:hypothetical protein